MVNLAVSLIFVIAFTPLKWVSFLVFFLLAPFIGAINSGAFGGMMYFNSMLEETMKRNEELKNKMRR